MRLRGIHNENLGRTNGGTTLVVKEVPWGPLNPYGSVMGIIDYKS